MAGLPPIAGHVADRISARTHKQVTLGMAPEPFNSENEIEIRCDGAPIGTFQFVWDATDPEAQVEAELVEALSSFLDEEFPDGWW